MNQLTRCSNLSGLLLIVYIQLDIFRAFSCPSSGATSTAVAVMIAVVIAVMLVVVGPTGPTTTNSTATTTAIITATAVVAPDDGHEDARNMLSCM
jgi:hypothetical protein